MEVKDPREDMLTMRQVCQFFGGKEHPLDQSTIYRWVRRGMLAPGIRMGRLLTRWRRSDCEKALEAMERERNK